MMNTDTFPWVAVGIGLVVGLLLIGTGAIDPGGEHALPLLTMLFMSEFGFIVTLVGAGIATKIWLGQRSKLPMLLAGLLGAALAAGFALIGLRLWLG